VAAFTDLLFGARIRAAAEALGLRAVISTTPERITEAVRTGARIIFIDLDMRRADPVALITSLKSDDATARTPIVGFASHLRTDALDAARAAGADRVLARGAFARALPGLVSETAPGS
jgi:CheY-like chemotaxis protein